VIYAFGLTYIYRLLRRGPAAEAEAVSQLPGRPIAAALEGSGQ
jgi:sulfur relay (sulfurtransferase) DsrC/TusE family protein